MAADLPAVGRALQDHLHITHVYRSRVPTLNGTLGSWTGKLRSVLRFAVSRRGPLSMGVNQAGGFVSAAHGAGLPELQLYFNPASYSTRAGGGPRQQLGPDPFPGFSMSAHACRPTSRGFVAIASGDPMEPPRIVPNYLSTGQDIAQALASARMLRSLAATRPLRDIIEAEILPGRDCRSDDALLQDFRARADTIFHPVGTCAMGPRVDQRRRHQPARAWFEWLARHRRVRVSAHHLGQYECADGDGGGEGCADGAGRYGAPLIGRWLGRTERHPTLRPGSPHPSSCAMLARASSTMPCMTSATLRTSLK